MSLAGQTIAKQQLFKALQTCVAARSLIHSSSLRLGVVESKNEVHPGYLKIKEKYKQFQVDDGVPVHLKGGFKDQLLYKFTGLLIAICMAEMLHFFYTSAYPKKAQ